VAFAARTDVVAPKIEAPDSDEEDEEESEEDDEDEEDFVLGEDEPEEEEKHALLNMILAEVLKKFRTENGRGPDSEELLELRRQVAETLNIHLDEASAVADSAKREAESGDEHHSPSTKKVKFTSPADEAAAAGDGDDSKPAAAASEGDGE